MLTAEELEKILDPFSMTQLDYSSILELKSKVNKAI